MLLNQNYFRSESEEEDRKTNLQGQLVAVDTVANYTPPKVNVISPEEGTLQDYLKIRDQKNTNAELKKLHAAYGKEKVRRNRIVKLCSLISQKILPTLGIYFVLTYWSAGLLHFHRINHLVILGCEVVFAIFYFTAVMFINYIS